MAWHAHACRHHPCTLHRDPRARNATHHCALHCTPCKDAFFMGSFAPLSPAQDDLRARGADPAILESPDSGREHRHAQRAHVPNPESFFLCAPFSWAAPSLFFSGTSTVRQLWGDGKRASPSSRGRRCGRARERPPDLRALNMSGSLTCTDTTRLSHGQPQRAAKMAVHRTAIRGTGTTTTGRTDRS